MENYLIVGKIGKPYGLQGWVRLHSFTDPFENILNYRPWYLKVKNQWVPIEPEDEKFHGKGLIVKFSNYNAPEQLQGLIGLEIAIPRQQLPTIDKNKSQYYWSDLQGLTVINKEKITLGTVDYLFSVASNDVMFVKGDKERLIPFLLNQVVLEVDLENKIILVDWDADF